jgi:hypothetical protein
LCKGKGNENIMHDGIQGLLGIIWKRKTNPENKE